MGFQKKKNVFSNGDVLGGTKFSCFFGTSVCAALFFNEQEEVGVSQAHRSQLATAAVCTEQHQMNVASCSMYRCGHTIGHLTVGDLDLMGVQFHFLCLRLK